MADVASRLVGVGAVAVSAVGRSPEYFREIMRNFRFVEVYGAEPFNSGRVDDEPSSHFGRQRKHLAESGRVHPRIVYYGDLGRFLLHLWKYLVDYRGFTHSRITRQKRRHAAEHFFERTDAVTCLCGYGYDLISYGIIQIADSVKQLAVIGAVKQVGLVNYEDGFYSICSAVARMRSINVSDVVG